MYVYKYKYSYLHGIYQLVGIIQVVPFTIPSHQSSWLSVRVTIAILWPFLYCKSHGISPRKSYNALQYTSVSQSPDLVIACFIIGRLTTGLLWRGQPFLFLLPARDDGLCEWLDNDLDLVCDAVSLWWCTCGKAVRPDFLRWLHYLWWWSWWSWSLNGHIIDTVWRTNCLTLFHWWLFGMWGRVGGDGGCEGLGDTSPSDPLLSLWVVACGDEDLDDTDWFDLAWPDRFFENALCIE